MAKSFKEIGKKAEALIEQGNEAERKVHACQGRVASANSRVAMARAQLAAARETDEEGNPKGDVRQAQAQLSMAQNQLAASQRALSTAKGDVARVNQEKQSHVQTIEQHNKVEQSNLQKLQRIKGSVFSQDSAALTKGMAERLNAAEDIRVALLRSMGIEAAAEYVPVDGDGTGAAPWAVGGSSSLDLKGEIQNYQGGSDGFTSGSGIVTPVGGGLGSLSNLIPEGINPVEQATQVQSVNQSTLDGELDDQKAIDAYAQLLGDGATSVFAIDRLADEQMVTGYSDSIGQWNGHPRTPNEILSDMKKSIRENWMNNFNADEWRRILPEKLYLERLELYRKGVAAVIGNTSAASLSVNDLEQLSRVQNRAYLSGCQLTDIEIGELYNNARNHLGNYVTRQIEYKMDRTLQARAHGLLQTEKYSQSTWKNLSVAERKDVLKDLLIDMNSILGTNVSADIDFFYEQSGSRGAYSSPSDSVKINEYILTKDTSYQLMQTMIHELRHAYQHHSVRSEMSVLVSSQTIREWKNNFDNYKSPSYGSTFEEYSSQPVEWDAKNFAKQFADTMGINPEYEGSWS